MNEDFEQKQEEEEEEEMQQQQQQQQQHESLAKHQEVRRNEDVKTDQPRA
jgi:hypothetical protein